MTDRPDLPEPAEPADVRDSAEADADAAAAAAADSLAVRRLLAEARLDEPMPDDVAARMDDVLAGLGPLQGLPSSRTSAPAAENVVPIAAHRRRKVAGLMVAAAAVVAGAVVLGPHLPSSPGSGSATSAGGSSASNLAGDSASPGSAPELGNTGNDSGLQSSPNAPEAPVRSGRLVVRDRYFTADARQGRRLLDRASERGQVIAPVRGCSGVPDLHDAVAATYRGAPAALVYRDPEGSSQVVDLYVCGSGDPVRSTTLTAR